MASKIFKILKAIDFNSLITSYLIFLTSTPPSFLGIFPKKSKPSCLKFLLKIQAV